MTVIDAAVKLDRVWCGDANGNRVEVFDPPWWRVDRWVYWLFTKRPKAFVEFTFQKKGDGTIHLVESRKLRALLVTVQPRKFKLPLS